jgi:HAD superfamily hydrolase (TIGR01509 family)
MGILDGPEVRGRIRAIIFDMDGVLVDSEPAMYKASIEGLREFGIEARAEDFRPFVGTGEKSFIGNVVRLHGGVYSDEMKDRVYEIYCRDVDREIVRFPAVVPTVRKLREKGYLLAVASAADAVKVNANIRASGLRASDFGAVVKAGDVVNLKPAPDIFLKAASLLGVDPSECIVCEDAENGVRAAKAGGMYCLGITSTFSDGRLKELGADWTAADIGALTD